MIFNGGGSSKMEQLWREKDGIMYLNNILEGGGSQQTLKSQPHPVNMTGLLSVYNDKVILVM